jgi:Domain of unknown function (DUF4926)
VEKIKQYQLVRLVRGVPDEGIEPGTQAVVIEVFDDDAFEIEVADDEGRTLYEGSVSRSDIESLPS